MKLGFIGCGNMASAVINGVISSKICSAGDIYIYTRTASKADAYVSMGAHICESAGETARLCDAVLFCVKPQQLDSPLADFAAGFDGKCLVVTMLAGKTIACFKNRLGENARVIRLMPNTPLLLGCGAVAMSYETPVSTDDIELVQRIFGSLGVVEIIDESRMDAVVAVNGSSPAYFYLFAEAMVEWAVSRGIEREKALNLVAATMSGSAAMLTESGKTPQELIRAVSSPGGTTLAALASLEKDGFVETVKRAMTACEKRSEELSAPV